MLGEEAPCMASRSDMAFAFTTLLLSVAGCAIAWVVIHAVCRRFLGDRVVILDRVLYFVFAVVFNLLVWYFAVTVCSAGMKQFLPGVSGDASRFVGFLLEMASGIPNVKALKAYELIGILVGTASLLVTHLLYASIIVLSRWLGYELHGCHAATRGDLRAQIGELEPDLTSDEVEEQAVRRTNWVVGWKTMERVVALAATLTLFVWIVLKFDVLLMQVQLAEMMGLAQKAGGGILTTKDVVSPDQLFRHYGNTGAVLVLKGLTYFYMGLLMIAAYVLHVSYHAVTATFDSFSGSTPSKPDIAETEVSVPPDDWDDVGPAVNQPPLPPIPGEIPPAKSTRVRDD
jgi:hypothetical protein